MRPYLLHQAVERAAARYPHASALRADGTAWSYAQLERASRNGARALRTAGMSPGARVGVWMRKSPAAVGALLAVLRAEGVYVPLDPAAPAARIAALAADCGLWGLFADADLAEAARGWPQPSAWIQVPASEAAGIPGDEAAVPLPAGARTSDDPAYILYTSGSTGVPKGVVLSHAHALNFIAWAGAEAGLGPGDRVVSHAPFHFDLSIFDLWATLSRGGEVCLLDAVTARFPRAVAEWIAGRRITVWYSVPSALVQLLPHAAVVAAAGGPRAVIFAGEVFPSPALRAWRQALPQTQFLNWYGPTETNVCAHYRLPPEATPEPLPIGHACPNFELALLDEQGRTVERGEAGFLWARGPGLLTGYWGDASRTAQVTQWRRSEAGPEQRWYNTGDLARRGPGGELYFEGRRDDLVKCRGYRISLLEVERALEACVGVEQAAVVAEPQADAGHELVGYVAAPAGVEAAAVRRELGQWLPAYMVPERIEIRTSLPHTSTGKVDRQRLRVPAALAPPPAAVPPHSSYAPVPDPRSATPA